MTMSIRKSWKHHEENNLAHTKETSRIIMIFHIHTYTHTHKLTNGEHKAVGWYIQSGERKKNVSHSQQNNLSNMNTNTFSDQQKWREFIT